MPQDNEQEQQSKLINIVKDAIQRDKNLREKYQIAEKFRFIRDRLGLLLEVLEESFEIKKVQKKQIEGSKLEANEVLVYVHLYNAQGASIRSWQSMLVPTVFYEHSVNRPIYAEKALIETFIRSKPKKIQHAYLTMAIKRDNILSRQEDGLKDGLGQLLVKVKEGSLLFEKVISFTHNEQEYKVSEEGELVK